MAALFTATVFLGAFLLFLVEPMFAKMALPLLGGAPAVWITAMLFYQTALVAGYGYAHLSATRLGIKRGVPAHVLLLVLSALFVPITLGLSSAPSGEANPIVWLLTTMALTVGLPFFVLSATSPLMQRWFHSSGHKAAHHPYFLYAAGNLGSMLALLAYPLLIEPRVTVSGQSLLWGGGFIVLILLLASCGLSVRNRSLDTKEHVDASVQISQEVEERITWNRRLKWIALAAVPSSLMMGVTTYATTQIVVAPIFWVIPLALYLLTFVIVFSNRPWIPHKAAAFLAPLGIAGSAWVMAVPVTEPDWIVIGTHLLSFFFIALLLHGELSREKPTPKQLTEFFLWMSIGGAIGGAFNAILAPVAFPGLWEYPIAIVCAALLFPGMIDFKAIRSIARDFALPLLAIAGLAGAIVLERKYGLTSSSAATRMFLTAGALLLVLWAKRPLRFAAALVGLMILGNWQHVDPRVTLYSARSFFGIHKVQRLPDGKTVVLLHGYIVHGQQKFLPGNDRTPQAYYYENGPVGDVMRNLCPPNARIAVVGLGAGAMEAWAKPGEEWTFFEIDPKVVEIATNPKLFTYISGSPAKTRIILGDARVSLARDRSTYDIIILDAFSSSSVPEHLLTREAIETYRARLAPNGLLVCNITNKHVDLEPLFAAHAAALGLRCEVRNDFPILAKDRANGKAASTFAVLHSRNLDTLASQGFEKWSTARRKESVYAWTDDFSSVLAVIANW